MPTATEAMASGWVAAMNQGIAQASSQPVDGAGSRHDLRSGVVLMPGICVPGDSPGVSGPRVRPYFTGDIPDARKTP